MSFASIVFIDTILAGLPDLQRRRLFGSKILGALGLGIVKPNVVLARAPSLQFCARWYVMRVFCLSCPPDAAG